MEEFEVRILPGAQPSDYALPLLGRSVLARMADELRKVTSGTLYWEGEDPPAPVIRAEELDKGQVAEILFRYAEAIK